MPRTRTGEEDTASYGRARNLFGIPVEFITYTSSQTATSVDIDKVVKMNSASANSYTIPPDGAEPFLVGNSITIKQEGAGLTTLVAGAGVTINTAAPGLNSAGQYAIFGVIKDAANTWTAFGNLAA